MPLFLVLAIVAVVVAIVLRTRHDRAAGAGRFVGTAAAIWVGLIVVALVVLTVGTLLFGR